MNTVMMITMTLMNAGGIGGGAGPPPGGGGVVAAVRIAAFICGAMLAHMNIPTAPTVSAIHPKTRISGRVQRRLRMQPRPSVTSAAQSPA